MVPCGAGRPGGARGAPQDLKEVVERRLGPCWEGTSRLLLHTGTPYIIKHVSVFFFLSVFVELYFSWLCW